MAKKTNHKKELYIIATMVLVVIIAIPALLLSFKGSGKQSNQPQSVSSTSVPTPEATASMKVFTSKDHLITFQYPANFSLIPGDISDEFSDPKSTLDKGVGPTVFFLLEHNDVLGLHASDLDSQLATNFDAPLGEVKGTYPAVGGYTYLTKLANLTIAGRDATQFSIYLTGSSQTPGYYIKGYLINRDTTSSYKSSHYSHDFYVLYTDAFFGDHVQDESKIPTSVIKQVQDNLKIIDQILPTIVVK